MGDGMSYSRWSNSDWYTYWSCHPLGSAMNKHNATFVVCGVSEYTAKQLRDNIQYCVNDAMSKTEFKFDGDEIKGYMNKFIKDVDERFTRKTKGNP